MENNELETWLEETKAKNLSKEDLKKVTSSLETHFYFNAKKQLGVVGTLYEHLFNQWQKEKEFSPKRGDRVLVWNDNEDKAHERIFLADIKGSVNPISTVTKVHEVYFKNNEPFGTTFFKHMKPLPTEQPTETDFKSQVIELIEYRMKINNEEANACYDGKDAYAALNFEICNSELEDILEQIKELC